MFHARVPPPTRPGGFSCIANQLRRNSSPSLSPLSNFSSIKVTIRTTVTGHVEPLSSFPKIVFVGRFDRLFLPIIRSTRSLNLIRRLYRRTPLGRHLSLAGKNLNLAHETRWGPPSFSSELINRSLKFIEIIYAQTRGHRLFSIRSGENL